MRLAASPLCVISPPHSTNKKQHQQVEPEGMAHVLIRKRRYHSGNANGHHGVTPTSRMSHAKVMLLLLAMCCRMLHIVFQKLLQVRHRSVARIAAPGRTPAHMKPPVKSACRPRLKVHHEARHLLPETPPPRCHPELRLRLKLRLARHD